MPSAPPPRNGGCAPTVAASTEASALPHGPCALKPAYFPSGVDVWQPTQVTLAPPTVGITTCEGRSAVHRSAGIVHEVPAV